MPECVQISFLNDESLVVIFPMNMIKTAGGKGWTTFCIKYLPVANMTVFISYLFVSCNFFQTKTGESVRSEEGNVGYIASFVKCLLNSCNTVFTKTRMIMNVKVSDFYDIALLIKFLSKSGKTICVQTGRPNVSKKIFRILFPFWSYSILIVV